MKNFYKNYSAYILDIWGIKNFILYQLTITKEICMIQSGFTFIAFLMCFSAIIFWIKERTNSNFFEYVPPLVIIYFSTMLMSTLGLWTLSIDGVATSAGVARSAIKDAILPSMIFLMLLRCDIRGILKLGKRLLLTFFCASFSIIFGFVVTFILFKPYLAENSWKTFGALAGSWTGGFQNMVAVQEAIGLKASGMGYTILIDSIDYSIWIMILIFLVSSNIIVKKFNAFNKADTSVIEGVIEHLNELDISNNHHVNFVELFTIVSLGLAAGAVSTILGDFIGTTLPANPVLDSTTWMILITTLLGIIASLTPLRKIAGSNIVSNIMLYTLVGLIASSSDFTELAQAPAYILSGFMILLIHSLFMIVFAKIFKIDLFTCAIASCANIGGVASSPVIAGAYNEALVPVGVLMGMLGAIIGTAAGIGVAHLLHLFV